MFGLGMPEILLILAIALIVIGPKKLPDLAKTLGRAMGEFKSAAQDFKRSIDLESTTKASADSSRQVRKHIRDAVDKAEKAPDTAEPEDGAEGDGPGTASGETVNDDTKREGSA